MGDPEMGSLYNPGDPQDWGVDLGARPGAPTLEV